MTTFKDGPAEGRTLLLRRAPTLLRVVQEDGEFDALDQLNDEPGPRESIYCYFLVENRGSVHLCGRDPR